ncbi:hypothetical protein LJC12_03595 [Odoribacter sp. OttesenSCG-928-J03]|nr:hypothetical protein [Odoribacter sp. OttesenSCG-928-J03]MDL2330660.1 hypothetical protein [Odoribacter sp. OttesenSCG-928-A06]
MKDKLSIGFLTGLIAPLVMIAIFYLIRFSYLPVKEFIRQAFVLGVYFKIVAVGVFFANLAFFFLFTRMNKNNASKGVIMATFIYLFIMLASFLISGQ